MRGFRDNEVLLPTGNDVIVISPLGGVLHRFCWRNLKERSRFYNHGSLTYFAYLLPFRSTIEADAINTAKPCRAACDILGKSETEIVVCCRHAVHNHVFCTQHSCELHVTFGIGWSLRCLRSHVCPQHSFSFHSSKCWRYLNKCTCLWDLDGWTPWKIGRCEPGSTISIWF